MLEGAETGKSGTDGFLRVRPISRAFRPLRRGYSSERLRSWASWLRSQLADGVDVYAYLNTDVGGHAPRDAVALRRLLETSAC